MDGVPRFRFTVIGRVTYTREKYVDCAHNSGSESGKLFPGNSSRLGEHTEATLGAKTRASGMAIILPAYNGGAPDAIPPTKIYEKSRQAKPSG